MRSERLKLLIRFDVHCSRLSCGQSVVASLMASLHLIQPGLHLRRNRLAVRRLGMLPPDILAVANVWPKGFQSLVLVETVTQVRSIGGLSVGAS